MRGPIESSAYSIPAIRPRPRTSATWSGWAAAMVARPAWSCAPRLVAFSRRPSSSITSMTSRATMQATSEPPKVDRWMKGFGMRNSRRSSEKIVADMATSDPPSDLATVMMSGSTPKCSDAHQRPVRPMPVWISSRISSAPASSQICRAAARYPSGATMMPPSPWIGSSKTAATVPSTAAARASTSPKGTRPNSGISGSKGSRKAARPLADRANPVWPW